MTRTGTLAAAVLALGLSYACLWFVHLGGYPFKISALVLLVAGLVFAVVDLLAPHRCACEQPVPADLVDAPAAAPASLVDVEPELHAARVRAYIDPNTTGPIPIVQPLDLDEVPARHRADRG